MRKIIWSFPEMGVPPKLLVYIGRIFQNGWFGGTPILGNLHMAPNIQIPIDRYPHDPVTQCRNAVSLTIGPAWTLRGCGQLLWIGGHLQWTSLNIFEPTIRPSISRKSIHISLLFHRLFFASGVQLQRDGQTASQIDALSGATATIQFLVRVSRCANCSAKIQIISKKETENIPTITNLL